MCLYMYLCLIRQYSEQIHTPEFLAAFYSFGFHPETGFAHLESP